MSLLKHDAHFLKGELRCEFPLTDIDPNDLNCRPAWYSPSYLVECILYLMGRHGEIPSPRIKDERKLGLRDSDLRFRPEDRQCVYEALFKDIEETYFEDAYSVRYDLMRFYKPPALQARVEP